MRAFLLCLTLARVAPGEEYSCASDDVSCLPEMKALKAQALLQVKAAGPTPHALLAPVDVSVGQNDDYKSFVHTVVEALIERPLGQESLDYYLTIIASKESADEGEWVEFGVFQGRCIRMMSETRQALGSTKVIHGFDSFQGLPSDWRTVFHEGAFNMNSKPPFDEPERFKWHVGWFNTTAAAFAQDPSIGNISFVHMDADMYISTAQAFEAIAPKLSPGVYIVFDELIGYPEYQEHEMKALFELLKSTGRTMKVIGHDGTGNKLLEDPGEVQKHEFDNGQRIQQNALIQLL